MGVGVGLARGGIVRPARGGVYVKDGVPMPGLWSRVLGVLHVEPTDEHELAIGRILAKLLRLTRIRRPICNMYACMRISVIYICMRTGGAPSRNRTRRGERGRFGRSAIQSPLPSMPFAAYPILRPSGGYVSKDASK